MGYPKGPTEWGLRKGMEPGGGGGGAAGLRKPLGGAI